MSAKDSSSTLGLGHFRSPTVDMFSGGQGGWNTKKIKSGEIEISSEKERAREYCIGCTNSQLDYRVLHVPTHVNECPVRDPPPPIASPFYRPPKLLTISLDSINLHFPCQTSYLSVDSSPIIGSLRRAIRRWDRDEFRGVGGITQISTLGADGIVVDAGIYNHDEYKVKSKCICVVQS